MKEESTLKAHSLPKKTSCCEWLQFHNIDEAKGYSFLGMGRGPIVLANIFLTTSILFLASKEAGCVDAVTNTLNETCTNRVHGIKPSSVFTFVAIIAGLLSAVLMPVIGAMVDYTPYRRQVGIYSAVFMLIIEAISIVTIQSTWFAMAILQVVCIFSYNVQSLATYAYLPDIARVVGEEVMTEFSGSFTQLQFMSQLFFLIIVGSISTLFGFNDVVTAHASQAVVVLFSGLMLYLGWGLMKERPPNRELQEGQRLITQGFVEIHHTVKMINKHYNKGVKWFFLSLVFAEAGTNAFMVISITYMASTLQMSSTEVAVLFFLLFLSVLPGAKIGEYITRKTNPNTSWKLSMVYFMIVTTTAVFVISKPERKNFVYIFGILWGLYLGWFYPAENLFFALCLPKGREAELSGLYTFCTQILVWFPPSLFTLINESGIHQRWGLMMLNIFYLLGISMLTMAAPWDEVKKEALKVVDTDEDNDNKNEDNGKKVIDEYNVEKDPDSNKSKVVNTVVAIKGDGKEVEVDTIVP